MMRRSVACAALAVALAGVAAVGCEFLFSYRSISAPLGTWGEIGIQVRKEHNNCTLPNPYAYDMFGAGIQILSETGWEEVGRNVLENWFVISLAQPGEGYLMISKTCTKEGYEEARMPVHTAAPEAEGAWAEAWEGTYPFELPDGATAQSVVGIPAIEETRLLIEDRSFELPNMPPLARETSTIRIFFVDQDAEMLPLLIVGEGLFWRYDHLFDAPDTN